jgi:lysophospholipase L1-like esterase
VNQRWPLQLRDSLANRGIVTDTLRIIATTGWRTDNLLNAITNQHLEQQHYNLVSLLIGVNNQYQGIPLSQYRIEFPQLLDSAIRYAGGDTSHVFIVSIPDYAYTPFGLQSGDQAQISQEIDLYNAVNKHIADSFHIQYFNITPISRQGISQPNLVAADGLHPSGIQYTRWVELMLQSIDTNTPTGLFENQDAAALELYPNPVTDDVMIRHIGGRHDILELYDNTGKCLFSKRMDETATISMMLFSPGIYLVRLISETGVATKKIIRL